MELRDKPVRALTAGSLRIVVTMFVPPWALLKMVTVVNNAQGGTNMVTTILRLPAVRARTGLSRSSIYLRISQERFPSPISLGGRAVGWIEAEINEWLIK